MLYKNKKKLKISVVFLCFLIATVLEFEVSGYFMILCWVFAYYLGFLINNLFVQYEKLYLQFQKYISSHCDDDYKCGADCGECSKKQIEDMLRKSNEKES